MSNNRFRLTRRSFLKAAAAGAGVLSLTPDLLDFKKWAHASADAPVTLVPTICNGCGNRCGIFAYVKNGTALED